MPSPKPRRAPAPSTPCATKAHDAQPFVFIGSPLGGRTARRLRTASTSRPRARAHRCLSACVEAPGWRHNGEPPALPFRRVHGRRRRPTSPPSAASCTARRGPRRRASSPAPPSPAARSPRRARSCREATALAEGRQRLEGRPTSRHRAGGGTLEMGTLMRTRGLGRISAKSDDTQRDAERRPASLNTAQQRSRDIVVRSPSLRNMERRWPTCLQLYCAVSDDVD